MDTFETLPERDALQALGRSPVDRRRVAAYALALPARIRPSSENLAALLGVAPSTVRSDWLRSDVRATARAATCAGLVAVMLAAARGFVVDLAGRAAAGDLDAGRELREWLRELGAFGRVTMPDAGDDCGSGEGGGALASADAAEALAALLADLEGGGE